jgi:predicted DNA-binding transcriptional regulator AlpA
MAEQLHDKLLRTRSVTARIGITRDHLYKLIKAGHFPPPVSLCGGVSFAWHESVIDAWITNRPAAQPTIARNALAKSGLVKYRAAKRKQP